MSLIAVRDELAKRLASLEGLRVYPVPPDTVPQLPAAIIQPGQPLAEYGHTLSGRDVTYTFSVLLLTKSGDDEQAWQDLAAYLAPTGLPEANSVKDVVESDTDTSPADWFRVLRATEGGRMTYQKTAYWGAAFQIQAYVGG